MHMVRVVLFCAVLYFFMELLIKKGSKVYSVQNKDGTLIPTADMNKHVVQRTTCLLRGFSKFIAVCWLYPGFTLPWQLSLLKQGTVSV